MVWRSALGGLAQFFMFLVTKFIDLIFPPLCVHCGREGAWLCLTAQTSLNHEQLLIDPLPIRGVDRVITRGSYDCEPLAQLIQKLKYHYWTGLSEVLVGVLEPCRSELSGLADAVLVPVPLHRRRQRERGFNQSLLISQALRRVTGRPITPLLACMKYTAPQARLSAVARLTNMIGAFGRDRRVASHRRTTRGEAPPAGGGWPSSVILVDDVITTGSTMAECASVLRQHGVRDITAVALAKG